MRTNCRAYTYTTTGYCYFKSAATNLVANAGFVTGAKTTGEQLHLHRKNLPSTEHLIIAGLVIHPASCNRGLICTSSC